MNDSTLEAVLRRDRLIVASALGAIATRDQRRSLADDLLERIQRGVRRLGRLDDTLIVPIQTGTEIDAGIRVSPRLCFRISIRSSTPVGNARRPWI